MIHLLADLPRAQLLGWIAASAILMAAFLAFTPKDPPNRRGK